MAILARYAGGLMSGRAKTLHYRKSHFVTQLPVDYLYTPSHAWVARQQADLYRVGLTKFATRMLGEMVDHAIDAKAGETVELGQVIGWVEGFKAISDLFCVIEGTFSGNNVVLKQKINLISKDPYAAGWLYEASGKPDSKCLDVLAYRDLLDKTIERLLAQRKGEQIE